MPCLNDKNILSFNLYLCGQIEYNVCQYKIFRNTTFYFNDHKPTNSLLHNFLCLGIPSVYCQIHYFLENLWGQDAGKHFDVNTLSPKLTQYITVCKVHHKSELSIHTVNSMCIYWGVHFKSKLQHTGTWSVTPLLKHTPPTPSFYCPSVFFHWNYFTALSWQKEKFC
jgi:hypothetical protein